MTTTQPHSSIEDDPRLLDVVDTIHGPARWQKQRGHWLLVLDKHAAEDPVMKSLATVCVKTGEWYVFTEAGMQPSTNHARFGVCDDGGVLDAALAALQDMGTIPAARFDLAEAAAERFLSARAAAAEYRRAKLPLSTAEAEADMAAASDELQALAGSGVLLVSLGGGVSLRVVAAGGDQ